MENPNEKTMIELTSELLRVDKKYLTEFSQMDLFNAKRLTGVLCRKDSKLYGTMIIFKIDNDPTCQIVFGTPKMEYPFNRNGDFNWPKTDKPFQFWEKLDGTNILSFSYVHKERTYHSFKTRLTPTLRDSEFGNFYKLFVEYLDDGNDWVFDVIENNPDYNLSFELYGYRNPILIKYESPLNVALLFGVHKETSKIVPLTELKTDAKCNTPMGILMREDNDLHNQYMNVRANMSKLNKEKLTIEGMMLYIQLEDGDWTMYKAKPEEIEKIHWANSGSIPEKSIYATAINLFENFDAPNIDDLEDLLAEEYSETLIKNSTEKIMKAFRNAFFRMQLLKEVNVVFKLAKEEGIDFKSDKTELFRFMSKHFDRSMMRKVGSIVLSQENLQKDTNNE